ncbi:hypothetical protein ZMO1_ZMO0768 [Zymomonas mobilis subsp. mobilis ZM4 = ATCC 31821]|uniref:Uncharacterized protein n=3 Tax=Zymomonas mobilis TaxID=542 RepID=Q5NPG8_ZYMMO|nr:MULTISPECIES: hypothetical protein [Zymomonas]AAV89392.2 hypothetical protein ZMO0768 [Zymomonas mobilis subsp. mobilis ZM4 = ATCC 31821]ACV75060.1 hypothetical protein Za10_0511 [Zymomonas mobilis subsp. mobilis NCIMB 11163]AEH62366.1 conserved hypothetical protein [Zymomonas mobilis subsp. mobilis ATCC 10988]AHB09849.1 hypothetical protein ZCP4_0534 [Zymomonas mobilis subsp. mobilis str. CP4 = NRRL B-14023]AHJ70154.1 hypothetical protein A254_00527 [Zymomonas mobilis subsp. mobilis NRRL B
MKNDVNFSEESIEIFKILSERLTTGQKDSPTAQAERKRQSFADKPSSVTALIELLTQEEGTQTSFLEILDGHFNPDALKTSQI